MSVAAVPVAAHDEFVLQLGAERAQPGSNIEVRGDLATGERFVVVLVRPADGARRVLGTIAAVEEGHFQAIVVIPAESGAPVAVAHGSGPVDDQSAIAVVIALGLIVVIAALRFSRRRSSLPSADQTES